MSRLTNSFRHVLRALERNPDRWTPGMRLPNGHGHCTDRLYASGATLKGMREAGFIEYGKDPKHSLYGYRITPSGRAALAAHRQENEREA